MSKDRSGPPHTPCSEVLDSNRFRHNQEEQDALARLADDESFSLDVEIEGQEIPLSAEGKPCGNCEYRCTDCPY